MRKISILLAVAIVICSLTAPSLAWEPRPGGTRISGRVVYESGDSLRFSDLVYAPLGHDKDNHPFLTIQYKTTTRQIPVDKISYILIVNRTCAKPGLDQSEIEMGLKAGHKIHAILLDSLKSLSVAYIDEITKEKQKTYIDPCLRTAYVKMIYFDEVGNLAFNSRSNEYYPASYRFDPYTGEKLSKRMAE